MVIDNITKINMDEETTNKSNVLYEVFVLYDDDDEALVKTEIFSVLASNNIVYTCLELSGCSGSRLEIYKQLLDQSKKVLVLATNSLCDNKELIMVTDIAFKKHQIINVLGLKEKYDQDCKILFETIIYLEDGESVWKNKLVREIKTEYPKFVDIVQPSKLSDHSLLRGLCMQTLQGELYGLEILSCDKVFTVNLSVYSKCITSHQKHNVGSAFEKCSWLVGSNTTVRVVVNDNNNFVNNFQDVKSILSSLIIGVMDPMKAKTLKSSIPVWDLCYTVDGDFKSYQRMLELFHLRTQYSLKEKVLSSQTKPCFPDFVDYDTRCYSFQQAKISLPRNPSIHEMAEAGFFLCDNGRFVRCFYCGFFDNEWQEFDGTPMEIHYRNRQKCPFLKDKCSSNENLSMRVIQKAKYNTEYETFESRRHSFRRLQKGLQNEEKIIELSEAGFYLSINDIDMIECYACRLALLYTHVTDDPIFLHASLSPNCLFLKDKHETALRAVQYGIRKARQRTTIISFNLYIFNEEEKNVPKESLCFSSTSNESS